MHLIVYIVLCALVGILGHHRSVGFVGFFLIAFVFTPLIALVILMLAVERKQPESA